MSVASNDHRVHDRDAAGGETRLWQKLMALAALTVVSASMGLTVKLSQREGRYQYSPASVLVIIELWKLVVSVALTVRLAWERRVLQSWARAWADVWSEAFSPALALNEVALALGYAVVNVLTFSIYLNMTPAMFFLLKTSSPVVTAMLMRGVASRTISRMQWVAIAMQVLGLLVTQVNPCKFSLDIISPRGYMLATISILISCLCAVWNDHVIKVYAGSVNVHNSILYGSGVLFGLAIFAFAPPWVLGVARQYSFWAGYDANTLLIITSYGSIGLVVTAVYKYADAVVKTFGVACSMLILFMVESMGFFGLQGQHTRTLNLLGGAALILYASYVYIVTPEEHRLLTRYLTTMIAIAAPLIVSAVLRC